ncbi:MAG TPA: glutathione transferase GstA [Nevskia sp.]|nr:glutathione transferase GstA [Rudaea sp.]HET7796766.1 glutathione transferase GstA [Nevskia sp.]HSC10892.1 glutathione transferase GstA [Rhodanobacteraceae bacterium]
MKLYFSPDACSLSPHIVLRELGLPFTLEKVDQKTKKTATGADFLRINPKGYVPVLELDDGQRLTEGPAIVQYLADRKPDAKLAPANGTFERARLQEWLNFISSEIHKSFSSLFNASMPDAAKVIYKEKLAERFALVDATLAKRDYLLGPNPSVADVYLFVVTRWSNKFGIDLGRWPALAKFMDRMAERASVKAALDAESQARKAA